MSTPVLLGITALLSLSYVAAGALVAARVAERSGVDALPLRVMVVVLWPIVATGIQILWLLDVNDWHLR